MAINFGETVSTFFQLFQSVGGAYRYLRRTNSFLFRQEPIEDQPKPKAHQALPDQLTNQCKCVANASEPDVAPLSNVFPISLLVSSDLNTAQLVEVHRSLVVRLETKGRAVYCAEDLKNCVNLLIERPFITWLDPSKSGNYCGNCFTAVSSTCKQFKQCKRCKLTSYCSDECSNSSIIHQMECDYAQVLSKFGLFQMASRVLFREFVSSDETTTNHSLQSSSSCSSSTTRDHSASRELANFNSLIAQVDSNPFTILICFCLAAIFTSKFLHLLYTFDGFDKNESNKSEAQNSELQIAVRLLKIALILKQNTMETYDEASGLSTGHALYLACALLNHACKPNCVRYFGGNQVVVRSLTVLPANSELTISYGLQTGLDYRGRREQLRERFGFDCLCADCCEESDRDQRARKEADSKESSKECSKEGGEEKGRKENLEANSKSSEENCKSGHKGGEQKEQ